MKIPSFEKEENNWTKCNLAMILGVFLSIISDSFNKLVRLKCYYYFCMNFSNVP